MTKEECIKIMAMLGAFYGGGKTDPKMQAEAWYLILGKYDYRIAEQAVLHFAENDTRDYATFPAVGKIVAEIKAMQLLINKPINEIINGVSYGRDYRQLSDDAQDLISERAYGEWLSMNAETFAKNIPTYREALKGNQQRLLTDGKDQ